MNILSRWQTLFTRRYVLSHLLLGIVAASVAGLPASVTPRLGTPISNTLFCFIYCQTQRLSGVAHAKAHYSNLNQLFYLKLQQIYRFILPVFAIYCCLNFLSMTRLSVIVWLTKLLGTRSSPSQINFSYY